MNQRGSGKQSVSLAKSVAALLDVDKVELSKTQVAAFVKLHGDHSVEPGDSNLPLKESIAKLLSLMERALNVFANPKDMVSESIAQQVMDDLVEAELDNTKTGKRLAGLLAILQEVNQSLSRVQNKINSVQKVKLPSDYHLESGYSQLKMKHLMNLSHKRLSMEAVQKEINSMSDFSKNGLFSELKEKIEEVKEHIEHVKRLKERVNGFWLERHKDNYTQISQDFITKPSFLAEDNNEFQELLKAYEKVINLYI